MNLSNIITQTKSLSSFNDTQASVQQAMGEAARLLLRCFNGVLELCLCSGTAGAHPDPVYTAPCNLSPWHSVCVCVCVCVSDGVHCSLCGCYTERVFINYHNYCKTPHTKNIYPHQRSSQNLVWTRCKSFFGTNGRQLDGEGKGFVILVVGKGEAEKEGKHERWQQWFVRHVGIIHFSEANW